MKSETCILTFNRHIEPVFFPGVVALVLLFANFIRLPVPAGQVRVMMLLIFEISVFVGMVLYLWHVKERWLSVLAAVFLVNLFRPEYSQTTYLATQPVLCGFAWYLLVRYCGEQKKPFEIVIAVIAIGNALATILQYFDYWPMWEAVGGGPCPPVGFCGNINSSSALMAICLPALFTRRLVWFVPVVMVALVFNGSLGGIVASAAVALGWLWQRQERYPEIFIIALLACMVTAVVVSRPIEESASFQHRYQVWEAAVGKQIDEGRVVSGYGAGSWAATNFRTRGGRYQYAHNEYVQLMYEHGLIGLLCLLGLMFQVFRENCNKQSFLGLLAIAVSALVHFPMHIAPSAMVGLTWLAMCERRKPIVVENRRWWSTIVDEERRRGGK